MTKKATQTFAENLLAYYDIHARELPWRRNKNPYHIWLSEIMLQQTTVAMVIGYFNKFLDAFPTVHDLAKANLDDVMHMWQGLGYYSRAANLHKCAQVVTQEYNGIFPKTEEELIKLPGIGPYTAAAISSIAFDAPASVVDGNVERVISRLYRIKTPLPKSKSEIKQYAEKLIPPQRTGDYSGAIMDLGATVCTPKKPLCYLCPVQTHCAAFEHGDAEFYPQKESKKKRPVKQGNAYIIHKENKYIYLQKRSPKGLLANLWQVPNYGWGDTNPCPLPEGIDLSTAEHIGDIKHVFTHFELHLRVYTIENNIAKTPIEALPPLPTLMKKVIKLNDNFYQTD